MTHARKQLLKRSDSRSPKSRKSVWFAAAAYCETDDRVRSTLGVEDEGFLEAHRENEDSVSEDFLEVSSILPFSI